jgi:hypothetical protein
VAELVDEEQQNEADGELPAPDPGVGRDRDQHRGRRREDLELEDRQQDGLELEDQVAEPGDRDPELLPQLAPAALGVDRLVVSERRLFAGLVGPEIRLLLRSELAHELMVAVSLPEPDYP